MTPFAEWCPEALRDEGSALSLEEAREALGPGLEDL
jgi:hypothetical protein